MVARATITTHRENGADPAKDTLVSDTGSCRTVLVGVSSPDQGVEVARRVGYGPEAVDGVQAIFA